MLFRLVTPKLAFTQEPDRHPVRQLPEQVVQPLAAGEVVERPASVVRNLWRTHRLRRQTVITFFHFTDGGGTVGGSASHYAAAINLPRSHACVDLPRTLPSSMTRSVCVLIVTLGFRAVRALDRAVARLVITTRHLIRSHSWSLAVEGGEKSANHARSAHTAPGRISDPFLYATPAALKF